MKALLKEKAKHFAFITVLIEVRKVLDLSNTIQLNIITQRWRMESMYFIPVLFRGLTEQIA